ncbi:GtrA family protein [Chryseobacterium sp. MP_3.2]|uniref:GtrA family protein n=1 Tax=Chryseobacterium sp. MP_3.2 TaxID=3071712 RepID=UPI002DFE374A|nr:putative flippase GtrA [Chryseobacterium sp. MP_3.2]
MKELLFKQKQILLFALAGALSAVIEIGSFKIFSVQLPQFFPQEQNFLGIHFPLSNIFSTTCGIVTNYFLSIWFVFERGKHSKKKEFTYFMLISFLSTIISLTIFQLFFRLVFLQYFDFVGIFVFSREMLSKISAIILVSVLNYTVKKNVIFNG